MLVFISWSGNKSQYVAEQLRFWLKDVMQQIDPWISSEDIRQGARWGVDVARKLEEASFGVLCVTKDNFNEPWIVFEAGALAKTLNQSNVCPYLIDLKPTEMKGPLVQFQAARATESETKKLVHSINKALGDDALPEDQVDRSFKKWWPDLQSALERVPQTSVELPDPRSDRDLMEELLERIRRIDAGEEDRLASVAKMVLTCHFPAKLFVGEDVTVLLQKLDGLGRNDDPNAEVWSDAHQKFSQHDLDGIWLTRWSGGRALSTWVTGVARIQIFEDCLYAVTHDGCADCLIAARRFEGDRFAGRYINLGSPSEVLPWAGRIVNRDRIDGFWTEGRWDLRRG